MNLNLFEQFYCRTLSSIERQYKHAKYDLQRCISHCEGELLSLIRLATMLNNNEIIAECEALLF